MKKLYWAIFIVIAVGATAGLLYVINKPTPAMAPVAVKPAEKTQSTTASSVAISKSVNHHIDSIYTDLGLSSTLIVGSTNTRLVMATISDLAVIPSEVFLYSQAQEGGTSTLLGIMHDDGLNGDLVSGDSTYTLAVSGKQFANPGTYYLYVSALFTGAAMPVNSSTVPLTVLSQLVPIDSTWSAYNDPLFSLEVPSNWVATSTSYAVSTSAPIRFVSFALQTDPKNPILVIYVYIHGVDVPDLVDEPPTWLDTDNRKDFYSASQIADEDPMVLAPLGLTVQTLGNDVFQAISTFQAK